MMEAAETSLTSRSAFLRTVTRSASGVSMRKLTVPSMMISSKGTLVVRTCLTARRAASLSELLRPQRSISGAETQPRPVEAAFSRIIGLSEARCFEVSFLESVSSSVQSAVVPRMTAPMTNGPAQGPRPTSSIPKIVLVLLSFGFLGYRLSSLWFFSWLGFGEGVDGSAVKSFGDETSRFARTFA